MAELRSAYVDGALQRADEDRVVKHLSRCADCREDVEGLFRLRQLLTQGAPAGPAAPGTLSDRLVSIAGPRARRPLSSRPFEQSAWADLPRERHASLRRTAAVLALVALLTATVGGIGYAAAPTDKAPLLSDPAPQVRTEFGAALAQLPTASTLVGAAALVDQAALSAPRAELDAPDPAAGPELSLVAATNWLRRAFEAAITVGYTGNQRMVAGLGADRTSGSMEVSFTPGRGSNVVVRGPDGDELADGFLAAPPRTPVGDGDVFGMITAGYRLTGATQAKAVGRSAVMVDAISYATGRLAARWWIDEQTGLVLWQQRFDNDGAVRLSTGFTSVAVNNGHSSEDASAPLNLPDDATTLTLSSAPVMSEHGWSCHDQLAGLSLVRLRSEGSDQPESLHMTYSDGLTTVAVYEAHGRLAGPPAGSAWDDAVGAYVRSGTALVATWQSGDKVFTVITDGDRAALADVAGQLPHETTPEPTTMGRVQAGLTRIINDLVG